jgi:hypothetical protein
MLLDEEITVDPVTFAVQRAKDGRQVSGVPASPMMHSTGWVIAALPSLGAGGTVTTLLDHSFDAHELFATVEPRLQQWYAVAERRLPLGTSRQVGRGRAVYLNLSPQRYLQDREEGTATEERRRPFLDPVRAAGIAPWIAAVDPQTGRPLTGLEVTAWSRGESEGERTLVFVMQNVPVASSPTGGSGAVGLATGPLPMEIRLAAPVRDAVDERTGSRLPAGKSFRFVLNQAEAVFFSFAGKPPESVQLSTVP